MTAIISNLMAEVEAEANERNLDVIVSVNRQLKTCCRHIHAFFQARKLAKSVPTIDPRYTPYDPRVVGIFNFDKSAFDDFAYRIWCAYHHGETILDIAGREKVDPQVVEYIVNVYTERERNQQEMYKWQQVHNKTSPCGKCEACMSIAQSAPLYSWQRSRRRR